MAVAHTGTLVLPLDKADAFRENLENWDQPLVTWNTIQGKKGESIDAIAKRHGLSGATLRQVNNLQVNKNGRLTASQPILVPGRGQGGGAGRLPPRPRPPRLRPGAGEGCRARLARRPPARRARPASTR